MEPMRSTELELRLAQHHRRADSLLIEIDLLLRAIPGGAFERRGARWPRVFSEDEAVSLAVVAAEDLSTRDAWFTTAGWCVAAFQETPPPLTVDDVRLLLSFDAKPNPVNSRPAVTQLALIALDRLLGLRHPGAQQLADDAADQLSAWNPDPGSIVSYLRDEALVLAGRPTT